MGSERLYDHYDKLDGQFGHLSTRTSSRTTWLVETGFVGEQARVLQSGPIANNGIMIHSQSAESMDWIRISPTSIEVQLLGGDGTHERPNATSARQERTS